MLPRSLLFGICIASAAYAQSQLPSVTSTSGGTLSADDVLPTRTYQSMSSTITLGSSARIVTGLSSTASGSTNGSTTDPSSSSSSSSDSTPGLTVLVGSASSTINSNATTTSSAARPSNTQPCNGWPEFCSRKYSNITEVCAHNSPFVREKNAGSNQALEVTTQLNDGIRMLQGQVHNANGTLNYCHSSCDLFNAGTLTDYLTTVREWVQNHPFDVISILIGNSDNLAVGDFTAPILASGLGPFIYTPPKIPMAVDDWPELQSMILSGKRVVIWLDYNADQHVVPWMLDEFSQMWETPFSPTDSKFPCTVERPPKLDPKQAGQRLYIANHNLNLQVSFAGNTLLVPNTELLNVTNAVSGGGSLGAMAEECTAKWNRPPNFLLVDYYNVGDGSVFEVAARMNGVQYNRKCCGAKASGASSLSRKRVMSSALVTAVISAALFLV